MVLCRRALPWQPLLQTLERSASILQSSWQVQRAFVILWWGVGKTACALIVTSVASHYLDGDPWGVCVVCVCVLVLWCVCVCGLVFVAMDGDGCG